MQRLRNNLTGQNYFLLTIKTIETYVTCWFIMQYYVDMLTTIRQQMSSLELAARASKGQDEQKH